jgi:hypothetical protein
MKRRNANGIASYLVYRNYKGKRNVVGLEIRIKNFPI